MAPSLHGVTVALPETRELDLFAAMLEERGATTWRCPLVSIVDTPDRGGVERWLREVTDNGLDWLVLLTGEGLRRLLGVADDMGLRERFVVTLETARLLTRGPKPGRALREIGLRSDVAADEPTTDGVIATLRRETLEGLRVGVQLYGQPNPRLVEFLSGAGAAVLTVAPYVYASAADDTRVAELIDALGADRIDVLAFTSKSQVDRLFKVAETADHSAKLLEGLQRTAIAAVGPIVAEALRERGVEPALMPEQSYFMKPLVREIAAKFARP